MRNSGTAFLYQTNPGRRVFFLCLCCCLLAFGNGYAQKRYNVWAFGDSSGINFNGTPKATAPTMVYGAAPPFYTASVCDNGGNLLFYTDGFTTWNAAHKEIPKFRSRWPWSGFVMPLICPYPDNDSLYYLFGVSNGSYANRLQYVTINMASRAGAIVYPPVVTADNYYTVLQEGASVALAGTAHCNGRDTWILTHAGNRFAAFLVTPSGVSTTPVVSSIPTSVYGGGPLLPGYGNLKFAANGEKLLLPMPMENKVAVFRFNNSTGALTEPVVVRVADHLMMEDAELSPDGTKLYVGAYEDIDPEMMSERHYLYQYDLEAGSEAAIAQSQYALTRYGDAVMCGPRYCATINRTMQLGPDGKIYVSMRNLDKGIAVIEAPNAKGNQCSYRPNSLKMKDRYGLINYNYIRSASFTPRENGIQVRPQTCRDQPAQFTLLFSRVDSVRWDFGDPASGSANFSTDLKPTHLYPAPGNYKVRAIIFKNCNTDTAEKEVHIGETPSVKIPAAFGDTVACLGGELVLDATSPFATSYTWENGFIYAQRPITESGTYWVKAYNACSEDEKTVQVKIEECPCQVFVPNAFTPNGDGLNDALAPKMECSSADFEFTVFDRYGGVAFRATAPGQRWTGYSGTRAAAAGVYLWTLRYRNPNTRKEIFQKGTVLLIR